MHGIGSDGKRFGFSSVQDWFESVILSFPAPWVVADLKGKYYGTIIVDARGIPILSVWIASGELSFREKAKFGEWTPERWAEYCADSHWESASSLAICDAIVALRNVDSRWSQHRNELIHTVLASASWEDEIFAEIECGGPDRRMANCPPIGAHS
jgi:hypothetical protein